VETATANTAAHNGRNPIGRQFLASKEFMRIANGCGAAGEWPDGSRDARTQTAPLLPLEFILADRRRAASDRRRTANAIP
jgi:hypothetical protein